MSKIVQLELELEEMQQRLSKLEELFTDLAKWTDFQKELEEGRSGNDQDMDQLYKIDVDDSDDDETINEIKIYIEPQEDENFDNKNDSNSEILPSEIIGPDDINAGVYEPLIIPPSLQPSTNPMVVLKKLQNEDMSTSQAFLPGARAKHSSQINKQKHAKSITKKPLKCYFCKEMFDNLPSHLKIHTGENTNKRPSANQTTIPSFKRAFKCPHCFYSSRTKYLLQLHIKQLHPKNEDRPFICKLCEKTFRFKKGLNQHKSNIHRTGKSFLCHYCPFVTKTDSGLHSHVKFMHEMKPSDYLKCYFCNFTTKAWTVLRIHLSQHTGECAYKCPTCPYETGDPSGLQHHVNAVHPQNTKGRTFKCTECPAKFIQQRDLNIHIKLHGKNNSRKCVFCPNLPQFLSINMLKTHKRKEHPKERRNYQCPHCPKMFKESDTLGCHINSHTGLKPYECPKCSYSCAQQSNLSKHVKRCKGKGRGVEKDVLVECDECNQKFTNEGNVKRHKARWHPKNILNCPDCNHIFRDKLKLQIHIDKRHGGSAIDHNSQSVEDLDILDPLSDEEIQTKVNEDIAKYPTLALVT